MKNNEYHWKPQKKPVFRYFLGYFTPLFLAVTFVFIGLVIGDYFRTVDLINTNETLHINTIKKVLIRDLIDVGPDLRILIDSNQFKEYLDSPDTENKKRLENAFSVFAKQRRLYAQIRFIDTEGWEKVRVDYQNSRIIPVLNNQLQNKSDRYYFTASISLGRGDIFVSPLDLNIEHGKVEIPHKPMIRFATPVFSSDGTKHGILILNYLAERMLERFDAMIEGTHGHIEFVNKEGYWIRSHSKDRNWGFMFDKPGTFETIHGGVWSEILQKDYGHIEADNALFNFVTIHPLSTVRESVRFIPEFGQVTQRNEDREWKIISDVSKEIVKQKLITNLLNISGPVWILFILVLTVGSWRYAIHQVQHEQLQIEAELHARVFSWTTEGVTITNSKGEILDVNNGFTRITGYQRDEVIGKNPRILQSGKHDDTFYQAMWSELTEKGFWEGEIYNRRKDGGFYYEWLHIASVFDSKKNLLNYVAIFSDITHKKDQEDVLVRQAYEDPLTGLGNRLALDVFLDQEIARCNRYNNRLALLYLDLNDFKPINDTYGHAVGDVVLREISKRLETHARETDKVSRVGGDEFCMALTDIADQEQIDEITYRIQKSASQEINTVWGNFSVSVSIGTAIYPDDASDRKSLIEAADIAMYDNKRQHKAQQA